MTGIVYDNRYLLHEPIGFHPESPQRLTAIYSMLEKEGFTETLKKISPRYATEEEISLKHTPSYIKEVENITKNGSAYLDADTYTCEKSYEIAKLAVGGVLESIDAIISEEITNAFAFIRPPGHHAESSKAMGFCIFNNVAVGAKYVQKKYNLKKILIIDWDLHHGNGTQEAFYNDPTVLYFSTHQYPYYPGTGAFYETGINEGIGYTINIPLNFSCGDTEYIYIFENILKPIAFQFSPDFIIVSAGFDSYVEDPLGGMEVTSKGFGALAESVLKIAEQTCQNRVLFVLEGGYNLDGLAQSAFWTLKAMTGEKLIPEDTKIIPPKMEQIMKNAKEHFGKFWKL